jgi:hypothetical protein
MFLREIADGAYESTVISSRLSVHRFGERIGDPARPCLHQEVVLLGRGRIFRLTGENPKKN